MKYNLSTLEKLEAVLKEAGYILRYERGNFQSGWCLLEKKGVVILNKFLDTEGRIATLLDLINTLPVAYDKLTYDSQKLYESVIASFSTSNN